MRYGACDAARDAGWVLQILNEAILHSTARYDYRPWPPEAIAAWFAARQAGNHPVIGAYEDDGTLVGFGSYGTFRDRPAYKYSVEHSLYVHRDHRGRGIGHALLQRLVEAATAQQYHCLVGGIDAGNEASIALRVRAGFVHAGTIRHAGYKFGRWLDLAFYQRLLATPATPVDG